MAKALRGWWPGPTKGAPVRESYVNLIPTPAGGTRESGLREGLFQAVKSFIEMHALQPRGRQADERGRVRARLVRCYRPGCWTRSSRARSRSA
ncbi:hypothetical protein ACTMU2_27695 [Cupriavidus basilensis]